mmetsp:Transcript_155717/g.275088  ORF Transcript_155717/g.275088 Transcript_155717/m.275088 type:complete len:97 (+) Transcript_155717:938-1228(+)
MNSGHSAFHGAKSRKEDIGSFVFGQRDGIMLGQTENVVSSTQRPLLAGLLTGPSTRSEEQENSRELPDGLVAMNNSAAMTPSKTNPMQIAPTTFAT